MADEKKSDSAATVALAQVREKVQLQMQLAEHARKLRLKKDRIEVIEKGIRHFSDKHLVDAANAFRNYVKILEDLKGVPPGGLTPGHFDKKKEMPEMMLLSGVFWDLTKLFDRTRSQERYADFKGFLGKYIQFSKGMPYQTMAAETMRKYIKAKRPVHMADFKHAHKQLASSPCFIATELDDYTALPTLGQLRDFRDQILKRSKYGRKFVAWYYRKGPSFARKISRMPVPVKWAMARTLDLIALATALGLRLRR